LGNFGAKQNLYFLLSLFKKRSRTSAKQFTQIRTLQEKVAVYHQSFIKPKAMKTVRFCGSGSTIIQEAGSNLETESNNKSK